MYIAQSRRKENIAEYILYLWQLEDLFRALQFSPEAIFSQLVAPHSLSAEKEEELLVWYMDIVGLLRQEALESGGHLAHTLHLISDLQNLHMQLMTLPIGANYRQLFAALSAELPALRKVMDESKSVQKGDRIGDIELCFRALYAVMLYRIRDGKSSAAQLSIEGVLEVISPVIAELSSVFHQAERGEIDLFVGE